MNSLLFEHFSCFLKNMGVLKCFDFFLDLKKGSFKNLQFSRFHRQKGYFFPKHFLKGGHILHARTYMCIPIFPIRVNTWYQIPDKYIMLSTKETVDPPVCIPTLSWSCLSGMCDILKLVTPLSRCRDMVAISEACLSPFRIGKPDTTM